MSRKLTIVLIAILAVLTGCQKEDVVSLKLGSTYLQRAAGASFMQVTATADWTISLEFPSGTSAWATVTPNTGSGSKNDIRFRYEANPGEESRQLTIVLTPGRGAAARLDVVQAGVSVYPDWLELPAMAEGDGCELFCHDMDGGKYKNKNASGQRNWSCYWDFDDYVSLWVAYPHNSNLRGSGSRSDSWGVFDPCLPVSAQPNTGFTYGGGWTRGHQIPSADRLNYAANVSTFYPTNMTPQDYDFNSGIWVQLENKVRTYATRCDTLYVVTGCLIKGSTQKSGNNTGFHVTVPTHYYKALLYYKKSSPHGSATDGYMAAGFIYPHDSSIANGNCLDYKCSIDELETQTGVDFFPNLERRIGKAKADEIEKQAPSSFWN